MAQQNFGPDDDDFDDDYDDEAEAEQALEKEHMRGFSLEAVVQAWRDDSLDNLYYFDTVSGAVKLVNQTLHDLRELTDEVEKNKERYLYLPKPESKQLKDDLRDFQKTIEDENLRKVLDMAFESPHVLSGFKTILKDKGDKAQVLDQFLMARTTLRIRQWMEANNLGDRFTT